MNIIPLNYKITLDTDLNEFKFIGNEVIKLEVTETINSLELDALNLEVQKVSLNDKELNFEIINEKLKINFKEAISAGEYDLNIEFTGTINDSLAGLYKSKYEQNSEIKYIATTQFEAQDARQVFPCFDAPEYKATFDICLIVDKALKAISNTLPVSVEEKGEKTSYTFETTPQMSTYLLYFGVGDFEFLEDKFENTLLRIVTTPGKSKYGKYALEITKKCLDYFQKYFDYPYVLNKLDLIAVPDFGAGAMENWGAITYRENILLYYPGKSSITTKYRIAEVVAHELAHQWFGNLVTMKWWDNLWLNESFATFMSYKAISNEYPEWNLWNDYVMHYSFGGMALDSLSSSHPIQVEVKTADEIGEIFDAISYDKGGSVLRMLENYIGVEAFRDGLRAYIKDFEYKNAVEKDLWIALEKAANKPLVEVLEKYIYQIGFPLVSAEVRENKVHICQKRFLLLEKEDSDDLSWNIPLVIQTKENELKKLVLKSREENLDLGEFDFIDLNQDYSGFHISEYSADLMEKLGQNMPHLSSKSRLGIVHDLFMLVYAGRKSQKELLAYLSKYYTNENDLSVLYLILTRLNGSYDVLEKPETAELLKQFAKQALGIIGFEPKENEIPVYDMLRSEALATLANFKDEEVTAFTKSKFEEYLKDENSLHADLMAVTFANAVRLDEKNFDLMLELYKKAETQEDKIKKLRALGFTKDQTQISKLLDLCLTEEIRFSHLNFVFYSLSHNSAGKEQVMPWVLDNIKNLNEKGGGMGALIIKRILQYTVPVLGIGREENLKEFFVNNKLEGLEMTVPQVMEELEVNLRFVRANY